MALDDETIGRLAAFFDVGTFDKVIRRLDSGFQSDNYHIRTSQGDYVLRILHDNLKSVEYSMEVYAYLADHGIQTAKPVRTRQDTFCHPYEGKVIVIQSFIPGSYGDLSLVSTDPLLPFYGRELGRVHQVLLQMVQELGEARLAGGLDDIAYVRKVGKQYLPDNVYIQQQYTRWEQEIPQLRRVRLTKGVIHGDVGPKDFFFKDGEYTGILDFNAAHLDYLLFDVAPMMMYCKLYAPDRQPQYVRFMTAYLETAPIQKEELRWLHLVLRTRWLEQIVYHQYRYVEGITQGLDSGDAEENLEGVRDGEHMLKVTNIYPYDHFFTIIK